MTMADHFWKSMLQALKRPTLDELYKRLRDLDSTRVDARLDVERHPTVRGARGK